MRDGCRRKDCAAASRDRRALSTSDGQWKSVAIAWTVAAASIRAITIGLLSMIVSFLFWADRALTREILFAV